VAGYTIYSYGDVDTLALIFNALAAITGGSSLTGAIAIVLILGFFGALISMAVMKHMYGVQWLIAVFLINGVLLVPKTTFRLSIRRPDRRRCWSITCPGASARWRLS
jgi:hypothetical protein